MNTDPVETDEDDTGHELDGETQLHYAGARYYLSALGRWNGPDPLADSFLSHSPYNYVLGNPLSLTDPTGLAPNNDDECHSRAACAKAAQEELVRLGATRRIIGPANGSDSSCPDCANKEPIQMKELVVVANSEVEKADFEPDGGSISASFNPINPYLDARGEPDFALGLGGLILESYGIALLVASKELEELAKHARKRSVARMRKISARGLVQCHP